MDAQATPGREGASDWRLPTASSIFAPEDGRLTPIGTTSSFETKNPGPGVWRLTPPFAPPQTPWLRSVRPFLLKSPGQFQPEPPIPLQSNEWVQQFNEIKNYGGATSAVRTPEQTAIARFYTANVVRQFNRAARDLAAARALGVLDTARLLAMVNTVSADALMSVLNSKYQFLFWRPVTAIDPTAVTADGFGPAPGFDDGNPATAEDEFLGTDEIDLDIHGFDAAGAAGNLDAVRHYDTVDELRDEIISARLWAGLHYRRSSEAGVHLGRKVAHYGLNHAFKPVH